jgi:hypothetical protein
MEMGVEGVRVVHAMPGRVRVKISRLKNNPAFAQEIQQRLRGVRGIQRSEVNLLTGSLLVLYEAREVDQLDSLISLAAAMAPLFPEIDLSQVHTLLDPSMNGTDGSSSAAEGVAAIFGGLNQKVLESTGTVDLKFLLPLGLFLLGLRGLLVAEKLAFPAWYDLLWFAFGTFFMLNPQGGQAQHSPQT